MANSLIVVEGSAARFAPRRAYHRQHEYQLAE
jgi:hypothetical protein